MKLRKPATAETVVQALLAVCLTLLVLDYFGARGASACSAPAPDRTHNCYPWGMTEGPMDGGAWNYAKKEIYLKSSLVGAGFLSAAILVPFLAPGMWTGLAGMIVVLTLDRYLSEWLTSLF